MRSRRYLCRAVDPEKIRLCHQNRQKSHCCYSTFGNAVERTCCNCIGQHARYVTVDVKLARCDPVLAVKPLIYEGIEPTADVLSSIHDIRLQQ